DAFGGLTWRSSSRGPTSIPGTKSPACVGGKTAPALSLTVYAVCRICSARPLVLTDAHRDRRLVRPPGRVGVRVGASGDATGDIRRRQARNPPPGERCPRRPACPALGGVRARGARAPGLERARTHPSHH